MSKPSVPLLEPAQVADILRDPSKKAGQDYLIVDVRGKDFQGGHIKDSLNVPEDKLQDDINNFVDKHKEIPQVVFLCLHSYGRGTRAGQAYQKALQDNGITSSHSYILKGGFADFQQDFKEDSNLVEGFNSEYWEDGDMKAEYRDH